MGEVLFQMIRKLTETTLHLSILFFFSQILLGPSDIESGFIVYHFICVLDTFLAIHLPLFFLTTNDIYKSIYDKLIN